MQSIESKKAGKKLTANTDGTFDLELATGKTLTFGGVDIYFLSTAVTANTTTTTAAAGSFAITSNATGRGSIFRSDGTKWQFLVNA